jgi:hypothetical protein
MRLAYMPGGEEHNMIGCKLFMSGKNNAVRTARVMAAILLMMSWSGCGRKPVGPSPDTPPRPQTVSAVKEGDVQRAIFTYEAPASKSGMPTPPVMGENSARLQV